jgi:hypothetical protein
MPRVESEHGDQPWVLVNQPKHRFPIRFRGCADHHGLDSRFIRALQNPVEALSQPGILEVAVGVDESHCFHPSTPANACEDFCLKLCN